MKIFSEKTYQYTSISCLYEVEDYPAVGFSNIFISNF
jgi:hypothetical protein